MIPAKVGLSDETVKKLTGVFLAHPKIHQVLLYGSRAMGNFKPASDIDLTLVSDSLTLSDLFRVESEIDELLLPFKIDLSLFSQIESAELVEHIKRVGIPFYTRTEKG